MAERLDALTVREHNGKSYWTKIGVAWPNKNGAGYIVRLDAMPAPTDGQFAIHLREPLPKDGDNRGSTGGGAGGYRAPASHSPSYDDAMSDDVPFISYNQIVRKGLA